ncbi:MAG: 3-dehydroquinate synthase [Planctomycetaceae bacterium]
MATIRVQLGKNGAPAADRSYDIHCGSGVAVRVGPAVAATGGGRAVIVADEAVASTHADRVRRSLVDAGVETASIALPSGEPTKSVAAAERLWNAFAEMAVDRRTHVVAVGGGVVGDLAGFVAATFARGLPVWHVPTTLVAQVDSAIGGKTGINLTGGKNLVGSFWQPRGVFADIDTLATLPRREFVSGLAEVVKYGVILDPELFGWLEDSAAALTARDPAALTHAVERSAAIKADVVSRDEYETTGLRAALNYGHTFAHAYETLAGYGTLLHGEAVAIGMARAARLAALLGRVAGDLVSRQDALLASLELPTAIPAGLDAADALLAVMARDKKSVGGRLRFVLPSRLGHVELVDGVPEQLVRQVLALPTPPSLG